MMSSLLFLGPRTQISGPSEAAKMTSTLLLLGLAVLLTLPDGFFVAADFALVKVRDWRIEQLVTDGRTDS